MGRTKKKFGTCYLCGKINKLTREHVPPECFSPKPLEQFTQASKSKFQYAWACEKCNHHYSTLEKSFKNMMLLGAEKNIQAANDAWKKVESENRKSLEQYGIPSKTVREILENLVPVEMCTQAGIYYPQWTLRVSANAEELKVPIKIARGLHASLTKHIIPNTYDMGVVYDDKIMYLLQGTLYPYSRFDTDFFQYFGITAHDDPTTGIWYMRFYKSHTAMVWFRPKKRPSIRTIIC